MPAAGAADPALRRIVDAAGRPLATYRVQDRGDWMQADVIDLAGDVVTVATELTLAVPGWRVATSDPALADALLAAGGRLARHLHSLEYDVSAAPPEAAWRSPVLPDGLKVAPFGPVSPSLAAAWLAAYPPTHPDHDPKVTDVAAAQADLDEFRTGRIIGPFLDALSAVAIDAGGQARAGLVVCEMPAIEGWPGGPWVVDIFVHPAYAGRGVASALLRRAVAGAADAGYPRVGLSVTDANPARSTYERLGFRRTGTYRSVALPSST